MNEQKTLPPHVHPEVALLPWYVNGTLGEADRQQIARHLESCATCRAELDELTNLRTELTAIYATQPGPTGQTARSVLGAVAREVSARRISHASCESGLARIDQWFRSFFMPRWVPTLVAVLLVTQVGLLLWISMPPAEQGLVSSRSLGTQTARLSVAFQHDATEEQIRSLLQSVRGRVIDGPTIDGLYTIEVLAENESTTQKKLETLKERTDVIRSAEAIKP
jgi:putative zinc finger protein